MQIYGQTDRELVLSRLYLLHTANSDSACLDSVSRSCFSNENVFLPTAVKVSERPRVDSDLTFESTDDVVGYVVQHYIIYMIYLRTQVILTEPEA